MNEPDVDHFVDVYDNVVSGATANPLMPEPDEFDEAFSLGANHALASAVELLRRLIPSHQAAAAIVVQGDFSTLRKYFSLSPKYRSFAQYRTPAIGVGIHRWLLDQRAPVRLTQAQLEAHPEWLNFGSEASKHPPMRGWLAAPLVDDDDVLGLLQLSDRETGDFTADDEAALVRFTDLLLLTLDALWTLRNARKSAAGLPTS